MASTPESNTELEEQNRRVQEEARAKIAEDEERRKRAMIEGLERGTTTAPTDFASAAKATEELEQPPSFANVRELEQSPSGGQPPAKNVSEQTLPEELRAENLPANEATVGSPSAQAPEEEQK